MSNTNNQGNCEQDVHDFLRDFHITFLCFSPFKLQGPLIQSASLIMFW